MEFTGKAINLDGKNYRKRLRKTHRKNLLYLIQVQKTIVGNNMHYEVVEGKRRPK